VKFHILVQPLVKGHSEIIQIGGDIEHWATLNLNAIGICHFQAGGGIHDG
jgi:hypothetical protein